MRKAIDTGTTLITQVQAMKKYKHLTEEEIAKQLAGYRKRMFPKQVAWFTPIVKNKFK